MTVIAGASQYLAAATVANKTGVPQARVSLMTNTAVDILDIGRSINKSGLGLSANARALNKQFLEQTRGGYNAIFGMSTVGMSSIENMHLQINALRSKTPQSQVAESLRGKTLDQQV